MCPYFPETSLTPTSPSQFCPVNKLIGNFTWTANYKATCLDYPSQMPNYSWGRGETTLSSCGNFSQTPEERKSCFPFRHHLPQHSWGRASSAQESSSLIQKAETHHKQKLEKKFFMLLLLPHKLWAYLLAHNDGCFKSTKKKKKKVHSIHP